MNITLSFISDYLQNKYPHNRCFPLGETGLYGVRMYWEEERTRSKKYCYICKTERLGPEETIDPALTYILVGREDARFSRASRIVIDEAKSSSDVFQVLLDMFDLFAGWQRSLDEQVIHGGSIQSLLECSAEVFGDNPLCVVNSSLLILGYVQNGGPGISLQYRETIMGKTYMRIGSTEEEHRRTKAFLEKIPTASGACFATENILDKNLPVIHCDAVTAGGYYVGRLTISQYKGTLQQYHLKLARHLSERICSVFERDAALLRQTGALGAEFFLHALSGNVSLVYMEQQLALRNWRAEDHYQVLCLNTEKLKLNQEDAYIYCGRLVSSLLPRSHLLFYDTHLVLICNNRERPVIPEQAARKLRTLGISKNVFCGCSLEFCGFSHLPVYYQQAAAALRYAGEGAPVVTYRSCLTRHVMDTFLALGDAEEKLHPDVKALYAYDKAHSSDLVRTLYIYLINDKSHAACAQKLFIHRSTVRYRMDLIRSMLSSDLDENENRMNLLISARLCLSEKKETEG